ncbi:MAG: hypothetical protein WBA43_21970 [Elainellaceae cyanobacterium]|jgi:hypothetical protein
MGTDAAGWFSSNLSPGQFQIIHLFVSVVKRFGRLLLGFNINLRHVS